MNHSDKEKFKLIKAELQKIQETHPDVTKRAAGILLICNNNSDHIGSRMLVDVRSKHTQSHPNTIGLFGGLCNDLEMYEEAALRELKEETGFDGKLRVIPIKKVVLDNVVYQHYIAQIDKEFIPKLLEHESAGFLWVTPSELFELSKDFHPGFAKFIEKSWDSIKHYLQ
jgi:8-oxo-dGTP pyrophosphatase MutT (NUDIX family)